MWREWSVLVGLGGSVGNWSRELTFPHDFHHPKQFWHLKMSLELSSDGTSAQALSLSSGGSSSHFGPCCAQPFAVSPPTPRSLQCFLNPYPALGGKKDFFWVAQRPYCGLGELIVGWSQTGSERVSASAGDAGDAPPGRGEDKPSSPRPSHRTRTCANATASAELMHFAALPRSCLSRQRSQNASGASRFQGLRAGGGRFRTAAAAEADADAATSALAQKSREQRARPMMRQELGAK